MTATEITLTPEEAEALRARVEAVRRAQQRQRLEQLKAEIALRELAEAHGFDPDARWQLADDAPVLRRVESGT